MNERYFHFRLALHPSAKLLYKKNKDLEEKVTVVCKLIEYSLFREALELSVTIKFFFLRVLQSLQV